MWEESVTEWYQSMFHPLDWIGSVFVMHSCRLHMFSHVCGLRTSYVCMVLVMVAVVFSCENLMAFLLDEFIMSLF